MMQSGIYRFIGPWANALARGGVLAGVCVLVGFAATPVQAADIRHPVHGTVTVTGSPQPPKPIPITLDKHVCGKGKAHSKALKVSRDGGLAHAVVSISPPPQDGRPPLPAGPVTIDQQDCRYHPHIVLAAVHQPVTFTSADDSILHNVRSMSERNPVFNTMFTPSQPETEHTVSFEHPERVPVVCDFHVWMKAWIIVIDNPYTALTEDDGSFRVPPLPPGDYTLTVWHELWGEHTQSLTIAEDGAPGITIELNARDMKDR